MEIILLFLLFRAQNDRKFAEDLRAFLSFYRDNRDFIALMMQQSPPMSENKAQKSAEKEESRPENGVGAEKILEEYLSRLG